MDNSHHNRSEKSEGTVPSGTSMGNQSVECGYWERPLPVRHREVKPHAVPLRVRVRPEIVKRKVSLVWAFSKRNVVNVKGPYLIVISYSFSVSAVAVPRLPPSKFASNWGWVERKGNKEGGFGQLVMYLMYEQKKRSQLGFLEKSVTVPAKSVTV